MSKQEFQKQVKPTNICCGGCLNGKLTATYDKLVELIGNPNTETDDYKTDAEWTVSFKEEIFAIYNWKNGKNYNQEFGDETEDIIDWNVGGNNKEVAKELIELIESVA